MKYFTIFAFVAYFIIVPFAFIAASQSFGIAVYNMASVFLILLSYYWLFVPAVLVKKHLNNSLFLKRLQILFVTGVVFAVTIFVLEFTMSHIEEGAFPLISSGALQDALGAFLVISFVLSLLVGSAALRFYERGTIGVSGNSFVTFLSYFYLVFGVIFISNRIDKATQALIDT